MFSDEPEEWNDDWNEEKAYAWANTRKAPGLAYVYIWYAALHVEEWKREQISTFLFREDVWTSLEAQSGILNAARSLAWKAVTGDAAFILFPAPVESGSTHTVRFATMPLPKHNSNR